MAPRCGDVLCVHRLPAHAGYANTATQPRRALRRMWGAVALCVGADIEIERLPVVFERVVLLPTRVEFLPIGPAPVGL